MRGDRLAAAALADDQRQGGRELPVVGIEPLERAARVRGPEDQPVRAAAAARGQRHAVRDVSLRVATRRAERVDPERKRAREAGEREVPAADDPGVGERVKVRARLLDGPLEALDIAARVADRAVDPDRVHGRADLPRELGVDQGRFLERFLLL